MRMRCPFCSGELLDDGSLSGQTVGCPYCGNQLQMPTDVLNPTPPPVNDYVPPPQPAVPRVQRQRRRRKRSDPIPYVVSGITLIVGTAIVVAFVLLRSPRNTRSPIRQPESRSQEARDILTDVLDSWVLGDSYDEFHASRSDIRAPIASWAANKALMRYEIEASRYNESLKMEQFSVTFIFLNELGQEVREPRKVYVERDEDGWQIHAVFK